ncbi:MAG TPA: HAD family hydrolase, partial [Methanothrix sp.]|nr:HAD family hydrolase [Methanothrix sp.]
DERASTGEDPTEQAIVAAALEAGHDCSALDLRYPRISEKAFSPERRMMSVKVLTEEGALICAKGASGTIIPVCDTQMVRGKPVALAASDKEAWKAWVEALSAQGMRVLAVAQRQEGASSRSVMDHTESGLCLLGVLSMADPLREEAAAAVALCKGAGIRPVLITGDHLLTAESVAREAGILSMGERGITGEMLESLSPSALVDEIAGHRVFARVSPAHKLKIVRTLSGRGEVGRDMKIEAFIIEQRGWLRNHGVSHEKVKAA